MFGNDNWIANNEKREIADHVEETAPMLVLSQVWRRLQLKNVKDLGERRIIEIIQDRLEPMVKIAVPFGDDVSAVEIEDGNLAVLKTDMLIGKTDVPEGMNFWQAARKAVVMNISDFAAKGVQPLAALVSLGLPRNITQKDIAEIGSGLNAGARQYGTYVIGGDTSEASDLVISVSLFGLTKKNRLMLRKGARPGDILAVTGVFGKTSAGIKVLVDHFEVPRKISKILVESVLMPQARLKEGLALACTGTVTAAIDSSDGLAWSLHEIARASNVGMLVDSLPIAHEVERFALINKMDSSDLALYGGEEYELVLAIKPRSWNAAEKVVSGVGGKLLAIGKVTARKGMFLKTREKRTLIEPKGYEHFKT
jgi:thiamine-monophosphate kinase